MDRAVARWNERAAARESTVVARGEGGSARVDPTDLDQILDNLLDNATAYAPGEVALESGSSNGRLFVAVQDRGPGIAADDLARVTERFYRGKAPRAAQGSARDRPAAAEKRQPDRRAPRAEDR
jgi:signal transduction histidine kinase